MRRGRSWRSAAVVVLVAAAGALVAVLAGVRVAARSSGDAPVAAPPGASQVGDPGRVGRRAVTVDVYLDLAGPADLAFEQQVDELPAELIANGAARLSTTRGTTSTVRARTTLRAAVEIARDRG